MNDPRPHAPSENAEPLLALLRERRTIKRFRAEPVDPALLERALDAGRFAPNHGRTEPWRFTLLGPGTRAALAPLWAEAALRKLRPDATAEQRDTARAAALHKWAVKPEVVIVSQVIDADPFTRREDYAAVACAIQNVQLAAWALGLGCQWSTTGATRDPALLARASVPPTEEVVGFLFLGHPAAVPDAKRRPLEEVLRRTP